MMQAVRGIYRRGVIELLETPATIGEAEVEVVVTFLTAGGPPESDDDPEALALDLKEDALPLDDFEPIVPAKPTQLSDFVLEDRR
jgi:hypothetical protein